jgi:hypothetical protein
MRAVLPAGWRPLGLHALVVALVAGSRLVDSPGLTVLLGGLLVVPVYVFIGLDEARRARLWFSPLSFYFFWYSVGLGASAIYVGALILLGDDIMFSIAVLDHDDIATGYLVFLVGSLSLHAGLRLLRPPADSAATAGGKQRNRLVWLAVFWVAGLWAIFDPVRAGIVGTPGRILQVAPLATVITYALTASRFRQPRVVQAVLLGVGMTGVFVGNVITYSKAYAMYSFLPLVWMCLAEKRHRRWLPILAVGLIAIYFGLIAPVLTAVRFDPLERESAVERIATTLERWLAGQVELGQGNFYAQQIDMLLMRQFDPAPVAYLAGEVQIFGFQHGETMQYARYAFIPRILWPNKPEVARGAWFATYSGFAESPEESTMSLGITATGELYWNFGVPGVILGMLLMGTMVGVLWRIAGNDPRGEILRMLLYVIVVLAMPNMSEFVSAAVSVVALFVVFRGGLLISLVLRRAAPEAQGVRA